jgi:MarR family 2-MHQ and catechol resistance regulon transcriptional repressor
MSTSPLHLWIALARAHAALSAHAEADVARHGITLAEFGVLEALFHKGELRQGELQRHVLVTSGGVTWVVNRLVQRGLVRRRPCPDDRRSSFAGLSAKGKKFMAEHFPAHREAITAAMRGLNQTERDQAFALLRKLAAAAEPPAPERKS